MNNYTLITGASSGIGLELARIAAGEGHNLILVARDKQNLSLIGNELLRTGVLVETLALDLTQNEAPQKVYGFCQKNNLHVTQLVNNAGFGSYGEFVKSSKNQQLAMIDLNIRALTELTHLFLPEMIKRSSGKIMNLGSVASFLPGPLMNVYFATKHYVLAFSEGLAEELRGSGVSITCLCPGPTKSKFASTSHVGKDNPIATTKVTAKTVAEFGWHHMQKGTRIAIHGRKNRFVIQLAKFLPHTFVTRLSKKLQH